MGGGSVIRYDVRREREGGPGKGEKGRRGLVPKQVTDCVLSLQMKGYLDELLFYFGLLYIDTISLNVREKGKKHFSHLMSIDKRSKTGDAFKYPIFVDVLSMFTQ